MTLGDESELFGSTLTAHDINMIAYERLERPLKVTAKIRYAHKEAPATLTQTGDDSFRLDFDLPQRAITRGQSVVVYDGDVVVCGGIID